MKNIFKMFISFCTGGAIGGGIAYFLLKKKFNNRIDAEVESVKKLYSNKIKEQENSNPKDNIIEIKFEKEQIKESDTDNKPLKNSIKKQEKKPPIDYVNYYSNFKQENESAKEKDKEQKSTVSSEKKSSKKNTLVVISPDEFEDETDYSTIYLTYYSDGVLTDETDSIVKIENTIGKEALKHFGEYEDDILHVRDDKSKIYYEVTKDNRKYAEVVGNNTDGDDEED